MIAHGSTFGRRLRALRLAKGLRQAELARLVGRHQTAIGPYERDEYAPPPEIVERLARALDTSAEYLLFGRHPRRSAIPLVGRIGPGGLAEPAELGTLAVRDDQLLGWPSSRTVAGSCAGSCRRLARKCSTWPPGTRRRWPRRASWRPTGWSVRWLPRGSSRAGRVEERSYSG